MIQKIYEFGKMIKFSHTIFAFPFALSAAILALRHEPPKWRTFLWIIIAMISARTAAMAFNRLTDSKMDAKNPRTNDRAIPAGKITALQATVYTLFSSFFFIFAAFQLNLTCFYLSPIALFIILGYSYTKRFTWLCHIVLGIGLALAPLGSWLAFTNNFSLLPIILGFAVIFWVSGFDIIYACQDYKFDVRNQLKSIPVLLGLKKSLVLARLFHLIAFALFFSIYFIEIFHIIYLIGLSIIAIILVYEHRLVKFNNIEKVNFAFFNMNGIISILYLLIIISNHFLVQI